jgi:CxxC motif-containing protein
MMVDENDGPGGYRWVLTEIEANGVKMITSSVHMDQAKFPIMDRGSASRISK